MYNFNLLIWLNNIWQNYFAKIVLGIVSIVIALSLFLMYNEQNYAPLSLSTAEKLWKEANPNPTLGVLFHYPPYEVLNLDGLYFGLTADYMRLLEDITGFHFKLIRCVNAIDAQKKFANAKIDALATVTPDTLLPHNALFTPSYISVPTVIITRKDQKNNLTLDTMSGMTVGIALSQSLKAYLNEYFNNEIPFTLVEPDGGYIGGLRALSMGDFDALLCDMAAASHYIATSGISNLRVAGTTSYKNPYYMAVRSELPQLASILDKGLESIDVKQEQAITRRWLGLHAIAWWQTENVKIWGAVIVISVAALFFFSMFWIYTLRMQVSARTAFLQSINRILIRSLNNCSEKHTLARCLEEIIPLLKCSSAQYGTVQNRIFSTELAVPQGAYLHIPSLSFEDENKLKINKSIIISDNAGMTVLFVTTEYTNDGILYVIAVQREKIFSAQECISFQEWLLIINEIVSRKRIERTLSDKEMQLQRAQRMEAIGAFAGGIAHDFNNILGAIIANGEMIEMFHKTDDSVSKKIKTMLAASHRGQDMVQHILSFTRRETETKLFVALSEIVQETINMLSSSISPSLTITFLPCMNEPRIMANKTQLHQIVMNLGINAIHAMNGVGNLTFTTTTCTAEEATTNLDSGITHLANGRVRYTRGSSLQHCASDYLILSVSDTGIGIEEASLANIFSPLFTTKTFDVGTGLGLSLVDNLVKSHRGRIAVESALKKGTVFSIYLPLIPAHEPNVYVPISPFHPRKGKVLIIDDEQDLLDSCREFLELLRYPVVTASSASEGLDIYENSPQDFALILTDYHMPEMNGDAVAAHIRKIDPDLPIAIVTGYKSSLDMEVLSALRIHAVLDKPLAMKDIKTMLGHYVLLDTE